MNPPTQPPQNEGAGRDDLDDLFDDIRQTCDNCTHPGCLATIKTIKAELREQAQQAAVPTDYSFTKVEGVNVDALVGDAPAVANEAIRVALRGLFEEQTDYIKPHDPLVDKAVALFTQYAEKREAEARLDELSYISPATRRDKAGQLLGSVGGRIKELESKVT